MITNFKIFESESNWLERNEFKVGDYVRFHPLFASPSGDKSIYKIFAIEPKDHNSYKLIKIDDKCIIPTYYNANYFHIYLVPDYVMNSEKYNL